MLMNRPEIGPFVILLQRSAEPVGKQLATKLQIDPVPIYGQVYRMGQKVASSPSGDYFQYTLTKNGHVPTEQLFNDLKTAHERMNEISIEVDDNDADDPANQASGETGTGGDDASAAY